MTTDADLPKCACPRLDAKDCMDVRYGKDLAFLLDGDGYEDDDERCECSCHHRDDDDDWDLS